MDTIPDGAPDGDGADDGTPFPVVEAGILELQEALNSGRTSSVELVDAYLSRIAAYDDVEPNLNAVLRLNPEARRDAAALDRERAEGSSRGPLHGIPVLLKDNYDMRNMPTSGASLALAGLQPPDDAFQVRRLREAGAILLGKTNLHELASGITTVSSLGGQTRNAYDPARNPGGSSGGTGAAVAASFAAVGWGSDTCGSIRIPAALNNLFGLRPTHGLSSIDGILPLAHSQDTGGPLARTATDLAIALDVAVGPDPEDPATNVLEGRTLPSFQDSLDPEALRGARIGSLEPWLEGDEVDGEVAGTVRSALQTMEEAGAEIVAVEFPNLDERLERTSVIGQEFKFDLADYLAGIPDAPVDSLGEILERGLHHEALDGVLRAWNQTEERDSEEYRERLRRQAALREAILRVLDEADLDALAYPTIRQPAAFIGAPATGSSCALSARSGLPALSMPAGFDDRGVPVGLELLGRPFEDAGLLTLGYAYERIATPREAPLRTPPLDELQQRPDPIRFGVSTGPGPGSGSAGAPDEANRRAGVLGTFSLDLPSGTLSYRIILSHIEPSRVHGVVLERRRGEEPHAVVERLAGPDAGSGTAEGTVALPAHLLQDLVEGNLSLGIHTDDAPTEPIRLPLTP